jgi:hypothetical protein
LQLNGAQDATPADPPRTRITESVASNDSNTTLPNADDDDALGPIERQNRIIASLLCPNYTPNAAVDYANDLQARKNEGQNIAAFPPASAFVAGRHCRAALERTRRLQLGRSH